MQRRVWVLDVAVTGGSMEKEGNFGMRYCFIGGKVVLDREVVLALGVWGQVVAGQG